MASAPKAKQYRNNGSRAFHLAPREKGQPYFAFEPGDIVTAADEKEAAYLDNIMEVSEVKPSESKKG